MNAPTKNSKAIRIWLPLLFSVVLIIGMFLGFKLQNTLRSKRDFETVIMRNDRLGELINLINDRYVDSVDANRLYEDAINGILSHLDPHTTYITADKLAEENELLDGQFFGIGVEFTIYNDTIYISSVMPEGPADKAGMTIGDRILKVGDTLVAGKGITSARIIDMLKGKQFSPVVLTLHQALSNRKRVLTLKRDVVPIFSIDARYMLDEQTGYIKINRFAATTLAEFQKAFRELKKEGLQQLIIDLRGNYGGYLKASTGIADELIDKERLLVYTEGKNSERSEEYSGSPGLFEKGRLAIIIDENSASASEILAGAIQDWDRGIITGRQSYGKGLVQQQFELPDGAALRLTVSRYFTPSGRSIQRSFMNGKKKYYEDYYKRLSDASDTIMMKEDTTRYFTHAKRVVYAKGGITPDKIINADTGKITQQLLDIIYSTELRNTLRSFYLQHQLELKRFKDFYDFGQRFNSETEIFDAYVQSLDEQNRKELAATFQHPIRKPYVLLQIKAQMARYLYGDFGYYYILSFDDRLIHETLNLMHSSAYNSLISRKAG